MVFGWSRTDGVLVLSVKSGGFGLETLGFRISCL